MKNDNRVILAMIYATPFSLLCWLLICLAIWAVR